MKYLFVKIHEYISKIRSIEYKTQVLFKSKNTMLLTILVSYILFTVGVSAQCKLDPTIRTKPFEENFNSTTAGCTYLTFINTYCNKKQSFKLYETIKRFCIIGWFVRSKSQRKNLKSFFVASNIKNQFLKENF